ncbi:MAG: TonB-dependent receptor, partial [Neisseriaceae bacterium]|nr:TonB-dependent receptor [Neisseriaceae bacterium]
MKIQLISRAQSKRGQPLRLTVLILMAFNTTPIYAENQAIPEEMVITATRSPQALNKSLRDVTVITENDIKTSGVADLPQLLAQQAGVEIASQGGAAKVTDLYLRGTNGKHTIILIDGVRILSATTGAAALHHIPLEHIARIEILRGPASTLYGADALGGVIQLFTKNYAANSGWAWTLGAGSYGLMKGSLSKNFQGNTTLNAPPKLHGSFAVSAESNSGFSAQNALSDTAWSAHNPDKDPYSNTALTGRLAYQLSAKDALQAQFFYSNSSSDYDQSPTGRDVEKSALNSGNVQLLNQFTPDWLSTLTLSLSKDLGRNELGDTTFSENDKYTTKAQTLNWQHDVQLSPTAGKISWGLEAQNQQVDSSIAYAETDRRTQAVFGLYGLNAGSHSVETALRYDNSDVFKGKMTGNLAYGYTLNPNWRLRASAGTAYKVPTFNDLYWPRYGNPNLQPETAKSGELGMIWQSVGKSAALTYFNQLIDNLISYQGDSAYNQQATIQGVTFTTKVSYEAWRLDFNATKQDAYDRELSRPLARRADFVSNLKLQYDLDAGDDLATLGAEWQYSGQRFDYVYGAGTQTLPAYHVFNVSANYPINR